MSDRDQAQRKADLDWLYGRQPSAEEQTRQLQDHELAELERRAAERAARRQASAPRSPQARTPEPAVPGERTPSTHPSDASASEPRALDAPATASTASARPDATRADLPPVPGPPGPGGQATQSAGSGASAGRASRRHARGPERDLSDPAGRPPAPPAGAGRTPAPKPSGRRRWPLKRIILAVVLLLVAWAVYLVAVPLHAWSSMKQVDAMPQGQRPDPQPGTAILLIGSDSRDNLTAAEKKKLRTGTDEGTRTDTMMVLYIPPSGRSVLLSLPRDSYVPIPGHGHNKINAAYSIGGPQLMMQTVEQDTGLRMDGYLEIGMDGFSNVIDSLGGIRMCLKTAMVDKDSHTNLKAGCQKLTGPQALGYVRMRKADPLGDIGRVARQRQMLSAVAAKAASFGVLANPVKYWHLNMAVRDALTREGVGTGSLPTVLRGLRSVAGGKGLQLTVPLSSVSADTAAGSAVLWDHDQALELFHALAAGHTDGLDKFAKKP